MPSLRLEKVNALIKRETAAALFREVEMPKGSLATVTRVESESDLKTAKIFLKIFPERESKVGLEHIRKRAGAIQHALNRRLAMRFVPQLSFYIDKQKDTPDDEEDIDKILDSLNI